MAVCPKDIREGIIIDRYLAPAITKFAIKVGNQEGQGARPLNPEERELRKEILALHQKWSKDCEKLEDDDIQESDEMNDGAPQKFTRMVQRKNQRWESNSRSRAEFDPQSIPDCHVKASVDRDFLFHETIPQPEPDRGYLLSSGYQDLAVVATKGISRGMDNRRTFILHGKGVHLVNQ